MDDPIPAPSVWVQWKGTTLCADFRCTCGGRGHVDDGFAYAIRCGHCGQAWVLPQTLTLTRIEDADWQPDPIDVEMDEAPIKAEIVQPAELEG